MAAFPPRYFSKRWLREVVSHVLLWERAESQTCCIYTRYLSNQIEQNNSCVLHCSPFIPPAWMNNAGPELFAAPIWSFTYLQKCLVKSNIHLQLKKEMMQQYIMYNCTQCKMGNWISTSLCYSVCWDLVSWHLSLLRNQACDLVFYT